MPPQFLRYSLYGVVGVIATTCAYFSLKHWNAISNYPRETRTHLRSALHAIREGRSGDAERYLHDALSSCSAVKGEQSVR